MPSEQFLARRLTPSESSRRSLAVSTLYRTFLDENGALSRDEFLAKFSDPFVLVEDAGGGGGEAGEGPSFRTVKFTKEALKQAQSAGPTLLAVKKRENSNAFGMMITVGRASNNDLVVPNNKVSKFHAYFRKVGDEWRIVDANSRNGTFLNGLAVPQEGGLRLSSGARIKLAKTLELVFFEPLALFERLQRERKGG